MPNPDCLWLHYQDIRDRKTALTKLFISNSERIHEEQKEWASCAKMLTDQFGEVKKENQGLIAWTDQNLSLPKNSQMVQDLKESSLSACLDKIP